MSSSQRKGIIPRLPKCVVPDDHLAPSGVDGRAYRARVLEHAVRAGRPLVRMGRRVHGGTVAGERPAPRVDRATGGGYTEDRLHAADLDGAPDPLTSRVDRPAASGVGTDLHQPAESLSPPCGLTAAVVRICY
ncbi:MAG: hypothetical protein AB7I50_19295 [Vicinamibacterales bacterium]